MSISTPTPTVNAIGSLNISGNVIPSNWWSHIHLPSGRPDSTAIVLLSDIVYWYRPTEIRDESTGALVGHRKRFHGDKLQRGYQAFADQFGFSKRETTDALKRLREAGLITLELRTVTTSEGVVLSNVLFVEPIPEAVSAITNGTPPTLKRNTPYVKTKPLLRHDVDPVTPKRETYTEITTKTTTEIKDQNTSGGFADAPPPAKQAKQEYSPEFETAWKAYPKRAGGNPKPTAWKHWKARLKEGVSPDDMLAGVKRYAAYVTATGKANSEYVKQAATFFGPDHHFAESWDAPASQQRSTPAQSRHSGFSERDYGTTTTPSWSKGAAK